MRKITITTIVLILAVSLTACAANCGGDNLNGGEHDYMLNYSGNTSSDTSSDNSERENPLPFTLFRR